MPVIYKVFGASESDDDKRQRALLQPGLTAFLQRAEPQHRLLFFGTGAWYKGYDCFLELLRLDRSAVGIHAGKGIRHEANKTFAGDPEGTRAALLKEGRLLETGEYVKSAALIDAFFQSIKVFVSPHRLTVSSGTMLQALDAGKPVLVPDSGLVGHRTKRNGLGWTYRYGDIADLHQQWQSAKGADTSGCPSKIRQFMQRFSQTAVEKFFAALLLGSSSA
jgi:glycosyltransferase involved in cell wall biosynthesis